MPNEKAGELAFEVDEPPVRILRNIGLVAAIAGAMNGYRTSSGPARGNRIESRLRRGRCLCCGKKPWDCRKKG